jgi:hypothetical protein
MTPNASYRHAIAPRDASRDARWNAGMSPVVGGGLRKQSRAAH